MTKKCAQINRISPLCPSPVHGLSHLKRIIPRERKFDANQSTMSKMKHLLRKLHIGGGFNDHNRIPSATAATDTRPTQSDSATPSFHSSTSSLPSPAAMTRIGAGDSAESSAVDFNFFEEEFQMQLALAISVSSEPPARVADDAETAQIKAAKERSLGCSPSESLVEFLSLRYWSNNVVNYDEKVIDGFYDVYGISSNSGKMPLLVDLEAISVSDNVDYEVILVNRTADKSLRQLEERVCHLSLECQALEMGSQIMSSLIQKFADIVVSEMGGPVSDADEMLRKWNRRSYELRKSLNTIILPLGSLDVGLSRHRALLFKVLADKINLPCSLVKGSYYTGTDDGAVNLIKFDNGSEYIIDLMGAPGTLIPAEVPSINIQNFGLDVRSAGDVESFKYPYSVLEKTTDLVAVSPDLGGVSKANSSSSEVASVVGIQSKVGRGNVVEKNQTERFEHDFGKLIPSLSRAHESSAGTSGKASPAQKLQVKDVSKYVISAAKNPEFAQKLHAVLLESGAQSSDLVPTLISEKQEKDEAYNYQYGFKQKLAIEGSPAQQHELDFSVINPGHHSTAETTSEGFVLINSGANDTILNDVAGDVNPYERQLKDIFANDGRLYLMNEVEKVIKTSGEDKESDVRLLETANIGRPIALPTHCESITIGKVEWEILWEDLQIGERIGIGSYGEVYRAEWKGTEVAVKKFMNQDISGDALTQFKGEVEIMLRLRHPNVVLFMGAVTRPPHLSILTEFLPRGSLFKLLHRPNIQLDEKRRLRMALDVAKGMNYLHTSNPMIVHRDLKTPNLLVDKNWVVKVCDFGMSRMKHHTFLSSKSTAGTPEWMAPEVLRNEPSNEKSDVYSFGVILWELATLRVPWTEMNSMQVVGAVGFQHRHLDIPEDIDPVVARIITDCWNPEQQSRPSFGQIISRLRRLQRLTVDRTGTRTNQL